MPSLLSFWMKCSAPTHLYHTTAEKMMKQLHETFSQTVNVESPGLAEKGTCMGTFLTWV